MFCTKCGNKLPDNALFCDKCGTKVEIDNVTVKPATQKVAQTAGNSASFLGGIVNALSQIGTQTLALIFIILVGVATLTHLIDIGWSSYIILNIIAEVILAWFWYKRIFSNEKLFIIPLAFFCLRYILIDIETISDGASYANPFATVLMRIVIYGALIAFILKAYDIIPKEAGRLAFLGLAVIEVIYAFVKMLMAFTTAFRSVMFYLGWTAFMLAYIVLECIWLLDESGAGPAGKFTAPINNHNVNKSNITTGNAASEGVARQNDAQGNTPDTRPQQATAEKTVESAPAPAPVVTGNFMELSEFIIDEKVSAFKFTNAYKVYNIAGAEVGAIEQKNVSSGAKAAQILLGSKMKALQAFEFHILDKDGNKLATLKRGGAGEGVQAVRNMSVLDANDNGIGVVATIPHAWNPSFEVRNISGSNICSIASDWKGYNYTLTAPDGTSLGTINKNWNGVAKELFTTADRYRVSISPTLQGTDKILVCTAAVMIDMIMHEI